MEIKLDKHERLNKVLLTTFNIVAVLMGLYHILASAKPMISPIEHSNIHLLFAFTLVFLNSILLCKKKGLKLIYFCLLVISIICTLYVQINYIRLTTKVGVLAQYDILISTLLLFVLFIATIKTFGKTMPAIAAVLLMYTVFGQYFPGFFKHAGFSITRVITTMTINFNGIYGSILDISATILAVFMIFGGLLEASGAGKFFINLALSIAGRMRSGPAQAAVLSSSLVGSINGSAVANVATTGVFTIPLMKKSGYSPEMAGATEAVASTGGMIMPPVMGVGAFIMSGITGIPYSKIALAALIPALLYYASASITVHLSAVKHNLKKVEKCDLPELSRTLRDGFHFLVPMLVIIYIMVSGMSAVRAGYWGIISLVCVVIIRETIKDKKYLVSGRFIRFITEGLISGCKSVMNVAPSCAMMGILSQTMIMSDLAFKLVYFIKTLSGGYALMALVLTAIITMFFGMGVPSTATYTLVAIIGASALTELGFEVIAVHIFIYYYSILANITPPVCAAVLVGSRIAESDYMKTGLLALRIGLPGFILPFLFMYNTELLAQGSIFLILSSSISALIGVFIMAVFFEGFLLKKLNLYQRAMAIIASILLLIPGLFTDAIGIVLVILIIYYQRMEIKREYRISNI